jgi:hypothetical protein
VIVGIVVFFLLALVSAGAILYPLVARKAGSALTGPVPAGSGPVVTDGDIERALHQVRGARGSEGLFCPSCGRGHLEGDRFCVGCGGKLPQVAAAEPVCPACGTGIHKDDAFCAKCGHKMDAGEVA